MNHDPIILGGQGREPGELKTAAMTFAVLFVATLLVFVIGGCPHSKDTASVADNDNQRYVAAVTPPDPMR